MPIDYCSLLETAYGLTPKKLSSTPGGQLAECNDGNLYILKASRITPEKTVCSHIATEHLIKNGLHEAQRTVIGKDGLPFAAAAGTYYTLSPVIPGRECILEDNTDLAVSAAFLARIHLASAGFTPEYAAEEIEKFLPLMPEQITSETDLEADAEDFPTEHRFRFKCDLGKMPDTFNKRLSELRRFRKNAKKRREQFDYEYCAIADYYCNLAESVCAGLAESSYNKISARYMQEGCLCHREYTAHNILMSTALPVKPTAVLGFDSVCIDMPVYDLANFIRRRMRKCGWSVSDAEFIVSKYDEVKSVSQEEREILKLLLQFPQKLWRIANKYYNSRRVWCEKSCLAKLDEVKHEKEPLAEFSKHFLT